MSNGYEVFDKFYLASGLEPNYQMKFSVIPRTFVDIFVCVEVLPRQRILQPKLAEQSEQQEKFNFAAFTIYILGYF